MRCLVAVTDPAYASRGREGNQAAGEMLLIYLFEVKSRVQFPGQ
ncbi:MAG TPA: hypothetical protein VGJ26_10180 [Pirellulales bacterium]